MKKFLKWLLPTIICALTVSLILIISYAVMEKFLNNQDYEDYVDYARDAITSRKMTTIIMCALCFLFCGITTFSFQRYYPPTKIPSFRLRKILICAFVWFLQLLGIAIYVGMGVALLFDNAANAIFNYLVSAGINIDVENNGIMILLLMAVAAYSTLSIAGMLIAMFASFRHNVGVLLEKTANNTERRRL